MSNPIYNLQDASEGERVKAPTREQIALLTNLPDIYEMISYAEDQIIAIGTIIQYYPDDELKGSRVAAIIFWKQASKNMKNRVNFLLAENKRAEKQESSSAAAE